MSGKIKAKDLRYDTALPPFLQRLHDQKAGRGDTDRHERPLARPTRAKDPNDDDGPTVVDESGETVSKEEYEKLTAAGAETADAIAHGNVSGEAKDDPAISVSGAVPAEDGKKGGVMATSGLVTKKRKAAKVVGDEDGDVATKAASEKKAVAKPRKKAKPIKLAFDEEG
ncbi:hypothetical protein B0A55_09051 [Friedmanniomyces simplex]|uniref:DUF4604 domain-containing protein n=1 Tax=Friedmanniomyces simplex TaxID=329884 RepID=A0A4U0WXB9_9PEZI|nr:hypothetical protein B0A55_09051 [Friedmanniomyces simplex]